MGEKSFEGLALEEVVRNIVETGTSGVDYQKLDRSKRDQLEDIRLLTNSVVSYLEANKIRSRKLGPEGIVQNVGNNYNLKLARKIDKPVYGMYF